MATELGLLSSTQLKKLAQSQQNQPTPSAQSAWMSNPKQASVEDDASWEVRAFAEDTGNVMGTTWPPRSYTCTFCRKEFRSAQALGGHMNVHRRDRARLHHQPQPPPAAIPLTNPLLSSSSSTLLSPTQELDTNGGYCLLYQLLNHETAFTPTTMTACAIDSPSTLLSISAPYPQTNLIGPSINLPPIAPSPARFINSSHSAFTVGSSALTSNNEPLSEELDLELRLGHRPSPT